jgi:flagellar P-ring protein FlgI
MENRMRARKFINQFVCSLVLLFCFAATVTMAGKVQIKELARIAGLEKIKLVGYGVVVGLGGTGDKDLELTKQTMANLLENFDISMDMDDISSKNVAAVLVTGEAPPFHKEGDEIDITVSSLGDASSLEGGTLLMTPLLDPNGEVYALAQGNLTVGGFSAGQGGKGGMVVSKNITTAALIPNGATIKHTQDIHFQKNGIVSLILKDPDFTTAERMARVINKEFGYIALVDDASTVRVSMPEATVEMEGTAPFIAKLEKLALTPDIKGRVVVNERTGTIVMGGELHISEAVIAHGNLTVTVKEELHPSQPTGLWLRDEQPGIRSMETPDVRTDVQEDKASIMVLPETTSVRELAKVLHLMGATPRDLISILEALKRAGAIQMDLITM